MKWLEDYLDKKLNERIEILTVKLNAFMREHSSCIDKMNNEAHLHQEKVRGVMDQMLAFMNKDHADTQTPELKRIADALEKK